MTKQILVKIRVIQIDGNAYRLNDGVIESAAIQIDGSIDENSWAEVVDWHSDITSEENFEKYVRKFFVPIFEKLF